MQLLSFIVTTDYLLELLRDEMTFYTHVQEKKKKRKAETLLCFCRGLQWSLGNLDFWQNLAAPLDQGPQRQPGKTGDEKKKTGECR